MSYLDIDYFMTVESSHSQIFSQIRLANAIDIETEMTKLFYVQKLGSPNANNFPYY